LELLSDEVEGITVAAGRVTRNRWGQPHAVWYSGALMTSRITLGSRDRNILHLAVPALGSLAADPLLSMVDTALVGHLGVAPLAALAISVVVFNLAFMVFNFLAYATTGPVARRLGSGRAEEIPAFAAQALWLALLLGIAGTVAAEIAAEPLGRLVGAQNEVLALFLAYFRIRILALTPLLITLTGHGLFRGLQDTRTPLFITVSVNTLNGLLAYFLIYPVGLGVRGAAIATLSAQSVGALLFLWRATRRLKPLARPGVWRPRGAPMRELLRLSRDLAFRTIALYGTYFLSTTAATRMGTVEVAAHQVALDLWMFLAMVVDSLAIAGQALIGRHLGLGQSAEARAIGVRTLWWSVGAGAVLGLGYWLMRGLLPRIFTSDPQVLAGIALAFPFVAALQPLNGYVFALDGILIGASDTGYLARWMTVSVAAAAAIILLALWNDWGLQGIWAGLALLMAGRGLTNSLRFQSGRWAR